MLVISGDFQQQLCLEGLLLQNQANSCVSHAYFILAFFNCAYLPKMLLLTLSLDAGKN